MLARRAYAGATGAVALAAVLCASPLAVGEPRRPPRPVTVVLIGDLMLTSQLAGPTDRQVRAVRTLLGDADLVIGNLESAPGDCLDTGTPEYPRLCATPGHVDLLPRLGFTGVSLANNHMLDAGNRGLSKGRRRLERLGLTVTHPARAGREGSRLRRACPGTEAAQVSRLRAGGRRLVLLAFNATVPGGAPAGFPKPVTPAQIKRCTARYARSATVITSIHHGLEYAATPSLRDAALVRAAIQGGAPVVVGHHPHVTRRAGWLDGTFVAWSLGNFISHQRAPRTHAGLLLRVTLEGKAGKPDIRVETVRYSIVAGWPMAEQAGPRHPDGKVLKHPTE